MGGKLVVGRNSDFRLYIGCILIYYSVTLLAGELSSPNSSLSKSYAYFLSFYFSKSFASSFRESKAPKSSKSD